MDELEFLVGSIGVDAYLKEFMRLPSDEGFPPRPEVMFDKVPLESMRPKEAEMYPHLVHTSFILYCLFAHSFSCR